MNEAELKKLYEKKDKFILDEDKNIIPANLLEWGEFFENHDKKRIVKQEIVEDKFVSTVFLGLDQSWYIDKDHKPLIFETMIFHGKGEGRSDIYCDRYATWKEAEEGHEKAVQWVKDGCKDDE